MMMRRTFLSVGLCLLTRLAWSDSVQPIVTPAQVLYGGPQHIIAQNSDVKIDTQTHMMYANKGITVSSVTLPDGTVLISTKAFGAAVWGGITGTLSSQTDLQTNFNNVGVTTASLRTSINSVAVDTGTIQTRLVSVGVDTGTLRTGLTNVGVDTGTLKTSVNALGVDTGTLRSQLNVAGVSTGTLQTQANAIAFDTGTLRTQLNAAGVSTGTLQTQVNNIAVTTGTLQTQVNNVAVATGSLQTQITSVGIDTGSIIPILLRSSNTWTGNQTWKSSHTFSGVVGISSSVLLNGAAGTNGQVLTSGGAGAIPSWTTASGGGSGFSLVVTTGTSAGYVGPPISSFSTTTTIIFDSNTHNGQLIGGSTYFNTLNSSSVTLQGNVFNTSNKLVQTSGSNQYPSLNGNLITNLAGPNIVGAVPAAALTNAILNQSFLQAGATFYASSGTVANQLFAQQFGLINGAGVAQPGFIQAINGAIGVSSPNDFFFSVPNGNFVSMANGSGLRLIGSVSGSVALVSSPTVSGAIVWMMPDRDGTVGQVLQTNGSKILSWTSPGGGGLLIASQTWSGQNNWTTPAQSSFTYGLTVGSLTTTGVGGGQWAPAEGTPPAGISATDLIYADNATHLLTELANNTSTGTILISTSPIVVGQCSKFSATGEVISTPCGTPGGSTGMVQYNSGGVLSGSNNFQYNGTSMTVISSASFTDNGVQNSNPNTAFFDIYSGVTAYAGKPIFSVGTINSNNQFRVLDQQGFQSGIYGGSIGRWQNFGSNGGHAGRFISNNIGQNQFIDIDNGGEADWETDVFSNGGKDIVFLANTGEVVRISSATGVVSSSAAVRITAGTSKPYIVMFGTNPVTGYEVAITTDGVFSVQGGTFTVTSCGTNAVITGNKAAFTLTPGAGASGCTVTFVPPFKNVPHCYISPQTESIVNALSYTETATALTFTQTSMSTKIDGFCIGQSE